MTDNKNCHVNMTEEQRMNQGKFVEAGQNLVGRHVYDLAADDDFSKDHRFTLCGETVELPSWLSAKVEDDAVVIAGVRVCEELLQVTATVPIPYGEGCGELLKRTILSDIKSAILAKELGLWRLMSDYSVCLDNFDNGDGTGRLVVDVKAL